MINAMKSLSTAIGLMVVMGALVPVHAEYLGCISREHPLHDYYWEVQDQYGGAVTIEYVNNQRKLIVEELFVWRIGNIETQFRDFARTADRYIIKVDAGTLEPTGSFRIGAGVTQWWLPMQRHTEVVFDLSPGPLCP